MIKYNHTQEFGGSKIPTTMPIQKFKFQTTSFLLSIRSHFYSYEH